MKLIKDILVFQIETTGTDPNRDHIIQLGAVLLDKDSLLEKNNLNAYVKVSFLDGTIQDHANQLGIQFDELRKSPKINEVIKNFVSTFGYDPLLTTQSVQNYLFLMSAFKKTLTPFNYDKHLLDVWSLGYIYSLHAGLKKIPTLNTLANHFNLKLNKPNDALERARLTGNVFKKIING